ncbi:MULTISPECIES: ABC transporter permease [unclassified Streptomyces]|uniref:ABC transporter permease n=1 Tax=unclassified Streptomyces TaxID=2593676 RepID=UPI000F5C1B30|nr:ABC transporter permease [Streptomyces sp. ADI95-17]RPK63630.1 ABC-2 family transporter protein [Streptomyces sp. ADI95-17]WSG54121.1 ABC transporter permease [Streptomyces sp. NBC_01732]WSX04751.1 ABC transporter permease [Streptomyces sp. NBC_00987]
MNALVKAEFRRLSATRLPLWALLAAVVLGGGMVGAMTLVGPENFDPPAPGLDTEAGVRSVLGMLSFTVFLPAALGTLAMTSEYRHRTATHTFLHAPRRRRVLTAKLVAYGVAGLLYGLVLTGTAAAAFFGGVAVRGVTPGMASGEVLGLLVRPAVAMAVYTLLGVAAGALIRHQVAALAVVVGYLYAGEYLLMMIPGVKLLYPLLPGGATASLTGFSYVADTMAAELATGPVPLLSPVGGALLLAGYALVAAFVAVLVPMRRDVH